MKLDIHKKLEEKMEKTIAVLKDELLTIRAGRANPNMLDRVMVDYYGTMTPLKQMAGVSSPEPRTILIQPWDKSAMGSIEKAITPIEESKDKIDKLKAIKVAKISLVGVILVFGMIL